MGNKNDVELPPRSRLAGLLAETLAEKITLGNRLQEPLIVQIRCGDRSLETRVDPEACKQLPTLRLQQMLFEGLLEGRSVNELGQKTGLGANTISFIKLGRRRFLPRHLAAIIKAGLILSPDFLELATWFVNKKHARLKR